MKAEQCLVTSHSPGRTNLADDCRSSKFIMKEVWKPINEDIYCNLISNYTSGLNRVKPPNIVNVCRGGVKSKEVIQTKFGMADVA